MSDTSAGAVCWLTTTTVMPIGETLNSSSANTDGRCTQPCEDGYPGSPPACNATPSHVRRWVIGHRSIVILRRMMVPVLLQDREHAGRRIVARLAAADSRVTDLEAIAVDEGELVVEAHQDDDRTSSAMPGCQTNSPGLRVFGGVSGGDDCCAPQNGSPRASGAGKASQPGGGGGASSTLPDAEEAPPGGPLRATKVRGFVRQVIRA